MNKYLTLIVVTILTNFSYAQDAPPKSSFIVEINDKEYIVEEGEELQVDSTTIKVKLQDFKVFSTESVSFHYPRNFNYQHEESEGYRNWTLSGNDFVIMYFELDVETELHVLARTMAAQFGRKNCKVVDTEIKIGAKTLKGKRINVEMAGQKLSVDLLEIEMSDSKSSFIAFQDVKDEDGEASAESEDVINMVDDTIEYH
jgi:hypothetical protein